MNRDNGQTGERERKKERILKGEMIHTASCEYMYKPL